MDESFAPPGALTKIAGFLPAVAVSLSALWPIHPDYAPGPIFALPLYLLAAAVFLQMPEGARFIPALTRQLRGGFWLVLAGLIVLALTLSWPMQRLVAGRGGLPEVLMCGAVVALALIMIWRQAVLPALQLESSAQPMSSSLHALGDEARLGLHGWLMAVCLMLLLLSTLAVAWTVLWLTPAYPIAVTLHALLIAPALAVATLAASRRQLQTARARVADVLATQAVAAATSRRSEAIVDLDAALYAAVRAGQVDQALALLNMGANAHALPPRVARDQRSLPMLAAVQPDLRLLRALIEAGIDLNRAHADLTPLFAAMRDSYHGRPDAVQMLLANGADPRATDGLRQTPLHAAARAADPTIAALLIDAGAHLDALDGQGLSPLGVAAGLGNLDVAKFLLDRRAVCEPEGGEPPLLLAAGREDGDPAMVNMLLKHKAKVDAHGRLGRTALHTACLTRNGKIVETLLAAKANPDIPDELGVTPLLEAVRAGAVDCVVRLAAQGGVNPAACDHAGRNALAIACQSESCDSATVKALLDLGVDPQQVAHDGRRAVDHAVAAGRWAHVALLDPGYVLPACLAEDDEGLQGAPPLMRLRLALERGSLDIARELLPLAITEPAELSALFIDIAPRLRPGSASVLADALEADATDADGVLLVWHVLALGPAANAALRALLERGSAPTGRGALARYLDAALLHAVAGPESEQMALALLERGADPFANAAGGPPLHQALRLRWHQLVESLLTRGVDPETRDVYGISALMLASQLDNEAMVRRLILWGAQPAARAPDGQTAQGLVLSLGRTQLSRWMHWPHWSLPRRPLRDADVVAAAHLGDADAVVRLLELGLALDATDAQGCTALLRSCGGGYLDLVEHLLAAGADPSVAAYSGATCLSVALTARQMDVVRVLAEQGIELDQRLPGGITPLMIAAALGQHETVRVLLEHGADPTALDRHEGSVLHALAQFGFGAREARPAMEAWEVLLAADAELDAANAVGETPLLLLLGASFEPGTACREEVILPQLEVLLRHGVDLRGRERRGFGPLHLAALHGLGQVVRRLLQAGADPGARDALNRRPAEIALMRGFVDIAAEFAPSQPAPSIARFLREPGD